MGDRKESQLQRCTRQAAHAPTLHQLRTPASWCSKFLFRSSPQTNTWVRTPESFLDTGEDWATVTSSLIHLQGVWCLIRSMGRSGSRPLYNTFRQWWQCWVRYGSGQRSDYTRATILARRELGESFGGDLSQSSQLVRIISIGILEFIDIWSRYINPLCFFRPYIFIVNHI